jgi:hypothetical protein
MTACMIWIPYGTLANAAEIKLAPNKSLLSLVPIVTFTKQTNTWFAVAQSSAWALNAKPIENFNNSVTYSIPCTLFTENTLYMVQPSIPETPPSSNIPELAQQHIQSPNKTLWDHKQSRDQWENSKHLHLTEMPSLNLNTELFIAKHTICNIAKVNIPQTIKGKII